MRIVHCTSVHSWDDVRIFFKMAIASAQAGHDTRVVALGTEPKTFTDRNVTVHRLPSDDIKGRLARATTGAKRVVRFAETLKPDVIHFHDPELLPWVALSKSRARKVYDVHEDLPRQISTKGWIPSAVRPIAAKIAEVAENFGGRSMDSIVAATPTIADRFPANKTFTVRNFPIPDELIVAEPHPYSDRESMFVYIGGITLERGLREMMSAAQIARHNPSLCLAGPLPDSLIDDVFKREPAVAYCGSLDRAGVSALLGKARAGLCVLHPTKNYPDALPVKLFEYMAAGLPVIASNFPLWREIVEESRCGICVDPLYASQIADAMSWILENPAEAAAMGQRGREAVLNRYNWLAEAKNLETVYK